MKMQIHQINQAARLFTHGPPLLSSPLRQPPLFPPLVRFRLLCQSIIAHKLFDYVVLAFIFLNCITVALERPRILQGSLVTSSVSVARRRAPRVFASSPLSSSLPSLLQERLFLTISNYIFTAIFVTEMTVKVKNQPPLLHWSPFPHRLLISLPSRP